MIKFQLNTYNNNKQTIYFGKKKDIVATCKKYQKIGYEVYSPINRCPECSKLVKNNDYCEVCIEHSERKKIWILHFDCFLKRYILNKNNRKGEWDTKMKEKIDEFAKTENEFKKHYTAEVI